MLLASMPLLLDSLRAVHKQKGAIIINVIVACYLTINEILNF